MNEIDSALERDFQHHHSTAVMMLARSKINRRPEDPYYGYRDLAHYVHDALKAEPFDARDLYLRLLACAKAERLALPTLGHMQALMAMVWDESAIPSGREGVFRQVCQRVSEGLCTEIGRFATESMKALAATLRVDLQVSLGYQNNPSAEIPKQQQEPEQPAHKPDSRTVH